jgi:hypothetical protein
MARNGATGSKHVALVEDRLPGCPDGCGDGDRDQAERGDHARFLPPPPDRDRPREQRAGEGEAGEPVEEAVRPEEQLARERGDLGRVERADPAIAAVRLLLEEAREPGQERRGSRADRERRPPGRGRPRARGPQPRDRGGHHEEEEVVSQRAEPRRGGERDEPPAARPVRRLGQQHPEGDRDQHDERVSAQLLGVLGGQRAERDERAREPRSGLTAQQPQSPDRGQRRGGGCEQHGQQPQRRDVRVRGLPRAPRDQVPHRRGRLRLANVPEHVPRRGLRDDPGRGDLVAVESVADHARGSDADGQSRNRERQREARERGACVDARERERRGRGGRGGVCRKTIRVEAAPHHCRRSCFRSATGPSRPGNGSATSATGRRGEA